MSAPIVAIIGRPNVGKSTFFNRVLGERRAVVHDRPGITRDRNVAHAEWAGRTFLIVDTGGFLPDSSGERDRRVRDQAESAIEIAQLVLFLVDAKTGATDLDRAIAASLRKREARCLLVVNKVDRPGDPVLHDFHRLGLGEPVPISAENGFGIGDLLDRALLGESRMIVEPEAGTTMDAVDSVWKTPVGEFVLVDTAGIRRQAHFGDEPEFFATLRAIGALERADVAGLVVDATAGFQRQEARLAQRALEAGCSVLLIYNKWDLVSDREAAWKRLLKARAERYPTLADVPALPVSALERTHLTRLPGALQKRVNEHARKLTTRELNRWLEQAQARRAVPSTRLGRVPRIYYVAQTKTGPPEFTLFVNQPSRLSESYRRYLTQHLISHFEFSGTPVRLRVRKSD